MLIAVFKSGNFYKNSLVAIVFSLFIKGQIYHHTTDFFKFLVIACHNNPMHFTLCI